MLHKDSFIPRLMRAARDGTGVKVRGDGTMVRDVIQVDDVISGIFAAWASDHSGPVILGSGQSVTVTLIAEGGFVHLSPKTVAQVYGAADVGLDGTGQTLVVLGGGRINGADLTAFWTRCGLPTTLAQFTEIDPYPDYLARDASEETKDVEWASAMAPNAKILYISTIGPERVTDILLERLETGPGVEEVRHKGQIELGITGYE